MISTLKNMHGQKIHHFGSILSCLHILVQNHQVNLLQTRHLQVFIPLESVWLLVCLTVLLVLWVSKIYECQKYIIVNCIGIFKRILSLYCTRWRFLWIVHHRINHQIFSEHFYQNLKFFVELGFKSEDVYNRNGIIPYKYWSWPFHPYLFCHLN